MRYLFTIMICFLCSHTYAQHVQQSAVQKVLNKYKDSVKNYGIIVLQDIDGSISTAAIGMAAPDEPLTTEHLMCIGSITKTHTATCIFILQDLRKLNANDYIGEYLKLDNEFIDPSITIKQLLNHSSGIEDFGTVEMMNEVFKEPKKIYTADYCLNLIDTIAFKKGTKHDYSNSNYLLLALIIEQVTQLPLEIAVKQLLLEPWQLKNTYPYLSPSIPLLARPMYHGQNLAELTSFKPVNDVSRGDGNIVTTAEDLHRFYKLLLQERKILKPESYRQMLHFEQVTGKKTKYGCGIFEKSLDGKTFQYHTGRQVSYIANCLYSPTDNSILIVLTNNMDDTYTDKIINELTNTAFY